ncbi:2-isopropylmalate synthase [Streptomyces sp. NPDC093109]|uniref:2-isopropylmalate synthase n=1 Tax=Streptomyces sp. NPDC093109 TaxID=3154977 RepID=UPI00344BF20E
MSAVDVVRESARAGRMVFFEESARDGAQAKTLMSAGFRVRLAREQGAIFGADGPRHVVFAASFPSVCAQEFEATRQVALETQESVSPAAICRGTVADVRLALRAVRGAAGARVMVIVAASEATARALVHSDARTALAAGLDVVEEAVGLAGGDVAVDVCLVDAPRADHALVAEYAGAMTARGAGTVVLADTVGDLLPGQARALFQRVAAGAGPEAVLVSHLHNDLGLGLANTLAALESGVRVAACSWLGMAERSGMAATEQLLFLLAHDPAKTEQLLGSDNELWWTAPDLTRLPGIAGMVSAETGVPLTVTTPIVGTGVATISTGTPFTHPRTFQPYDPQHHLGLAPTVVLTHLASQRVLRAVAERLGYDLDPARTRTALAWVKDRAYRLGRAVVPDADFATYLDGLTADTTASAPAPTPALTTTSAPAPAPAPAS